MFTETKHIFFLDFLHVDRRNTNQFCAIHHQIYEWMGPSGVNHRSSRHVPFGLSPKHLKLQTGLSFSLSLSPFLSHSLFSYDILIPRSHVSSIQWFIHIIRKNSISYRPLSMIQIWPHILLCKFLTLITLQSHYNWLIIFQKQFVSVVFKCTMTTIVGVRNQWHNYTKMVGRSFIIIKFKSSGEYRSSW